MSLKLALTIAVRIMGIKEYAKHIRDEWYWLWHGDDNDPVWTDLKTLPVSSELSRGRHRVVFN